MPARSHLEVVQLSDLHITDAPGQKGALGQDSDAGLSAVLRAIAEEGWPDVVVATGDLADKGTAVAYERMAQAFADVGVAVHCLAGNHDHHDPLTATLAGSSVRIDGAVEVGDWLLVFVDTNAHGRERTPGGAWHDRPDRHLAAEHGGLTPEELDRARSALAPSPQRNALLLVHHPPLTPDGAESDSDYTAQLRELMRAHAGVRAITGGHFHTAFEAELDGVPVLVTPSTSLNLDMRAGTYAAPGYRRLRLHADGTVTSSVRFLDDEFPDAATRRAPPSLIELMLGRITLDELRALSDEQYLARFGSPRSGRF